MLAATIVAGAYGARTADAARMDIVARAGSQELPAERLAGMIAYANLPNNEGVARTLTKLWVSYQLLGYAGAHGDSLAGPSVEDSAMWATIDSAKAARYYLVARKAFMRPDTTNLEHQYETGNLFAAQHILILVPQDGAGMSQAKQDSLRKVAEDILAKVTSANFSAMAKQYTEEPSGKERNGNLGVFAAGTMLPEFENAVRALKPGEISKRLVRTSFGFHIIRRNLLSEVRAEFIDQLGAAGEADASREFVAQLEANGQIAIVPSALVTARHALANPDEFIRDRTVLATSRGGPFTAGQLARWVQGYSPQAQDQLAQRVGAAADSDVTAFVRSLIVKELLILEADKANVAVDSESYQTIRGLFRTMVVTASQGLAIDPKSLTDSAKTVAARERLAAARVNRALGQVLATSGNNFVDVPQQLAAALRARYPWSVNPAPFSRVVARATAVRAYIDSSRTRRGR